MAWSDRTKGALESAKTGSTQYRIELYSKSLEMLLANPAGTGLGSYEFGFIPYKSHGDLPTTEGIVDKTPHSELLRWGIENGWLYIIILVIFCWCLLSNLWRLPIEKALRLSIVGSFLIALPQILFQFPFENAFPFFHFSGLLALTCSGSRTVKVPANRSYLLFGVACFSVVIGFGFFLSKYNEFNFQNRIDKLGLACSLYPANWHACTREIELEIDAQQYDAAKENLKKELHRRPFNFLALKNSIILQMKTQQKTPCLELRAYDWLFDENSSVHSLTESNCENSPFKDREGLLRFFNTDVHPFAKW